MPRLKELVAVVTGGGSGFGAGICRHFAAEGARVVVSDIDDEAARRVAAEIGAAEGTAVAFRADVGLSADMAALAAEAARRFGRIDVLVNNAGTSHPNQPMLEVSEEAFDRVYRVNVKSLFWAARHFVPIFRAQGGGAIINIASTAGVRPRPGLTWYNGSKGAVIALTKSMAAELAPDRIRVNAINPVMGETGLLSTFLGADTPQARRRVIATIPLGRLSVPADIANAAVFFADPASAFVTGSCLEVDGGRCI